MDQNRRSLCVEKSTNLRFLSAVNGSYRGHITQEGVKSILHDSPMNNNRNLFFPNKETGEAASMSSRSKTGAKMEACDY
jgi:hypothetical protein